MARDRRYNFSEDYDIDPYITDVLSARDRRIVEESAYTDGQVLWITTGAFVIGAISALVLAKYSA